MDFAALSNSLKQFLDIFDKTNISSDTVLKSPQDNQPSKELVAEFEQYMQEPAQTPPAADNDPVSAANPAESVTQVQADDSLRAEFSNNTVSEPQKIRAAEQSADISAQPQEYLEEIQQIFAQIENNELSASNLFRLQYLTNMLNVQVTQNNSLSKSSTEQFETFLKQQG